MATIEQIRAARALLNWSQKELADAAGLSQTGIARIENGAHQPTTQSLHKIKAALEDSGIEFIQGGVLRRDDSVRIITGPDCYMRLLEDVQATLADRPAKDRELMIWCADDRQSPAAVNDMYRAMRRDGIRMRQLTAEGNSWLLGPLEEYRYIPADYFVNVVKLNYGDKFATVNGTETRVMIHKDEDASRSQRAIFDLLWSVLPQPKRSDADERF